MIDSNKARLFQAIGANRRTIALVAAAVLVLPVALLVLPGFANIASASGNGKSRAPEGIGTTLAFDDGKVVTVQYSQIYFCNSSGPPTSATSSPCIIGQDATKGPVPDTAANTLNVIVPAFVGTGGLVAGSPSNTISGLPRSGSLFDPTLGANVFSQCPDNNSNLGCINHPHFVNAPLLGGVVPLPIHSHIISGHGTKGAQGGWWELKSWVVTDSSIWPDPSTGTCSSPKGGCLTSEAALQTALQNGQVSGPTPTSIYLHFNVVSANAK